MIFQAEWFEPATLYAAWLPLALLLAAAAKPAWQAVQQYKSAVVVAVCILAAAWSLNAAPEGGQLAGISYHLLALNFTALMIGAPAALWLGAMLLFPHLWLFGGDIQSYPANALALLLPPLAVNLAARTAVNRLPANIFIFIFINGFIASALSMLATGAVLTATLAGAGSFSDGILWQSAFPVFFLMAWVEAFLSGIATAVFIAMRPQWIQTFDDGKYLKSKNTIWF
ncbi:energy-coupling factor ABC transporter permease [Neisseria chenwenguii]|uniref:energy-coupling factor ABC transporter permease n=1 Tax=Neisseria chenwenguii TaxID=1853278 RepID=UPI000F507105|nr:energy-coupling factor ABC transporter permease [Neisseria chenwenguii]ROV55470.1 hypothetical protein EGS38_09730 [Neisseria chenwenguii]